jgi:hypothetical protein
MDSAMAGFGGTFARQTGTHGEAEVWVTGCHRDQKWIAT